MKKEDERNLAWAGRGPESTRPRGGRVGTTHLASVRQGGNLERLGKRRGAYQNRVLEGRGNTKTCSLE